MKLWHYLMIFIIVIIMTVLLLLYMLMITEMNLFIVCVMHFCVLCRGFHYFVIVLMSLMHMHIMFFVVLYWTLLFLWAWCILICHIAVYMNIPFIRRGAIFIRSCRWHLWWLLWMWRKRWRCWECSLCCCCCCCCSLRMRVWSVIIIILFILSIFLFILFIMIIVIWSYFLRML